MTNERRNEAGQADQAERGREPAEGRVDVSQPSNATAREAEREHERRPGGSAGPESARSNPADVGRSDLDMDVPNEGFGVEPDETDDELREALRHEPPIS